MGQWSGLPADLLNLIEAQLAFVDKFRVRAVCGSWNSYLPKMPKTPKVQGRQLPWLLQAFENNSEASHGLFNLLEQEFCPLDLVELKDKFFKGSSHGWVITFEDMPAESSSSSPDIHLFNLLTRVQIQLPPRSTFPDVKDYRADRTREEYALLEINGVESYFIESYEVHLHLTHKVVLSSPPSSEDCVAVAIYSGFGRLAWCKLNDKKWTPLENPGDPPSLIQDVIFHHNKLHVINTIGELIVFDNIGPNPKLEKIAAAPKDYLGTTLYLVEGSDGELIMVDRFIGESEEGSSTIVCTESFDTYKYDSINMRWVEVNNIGDEMLFLGFNLSLAISALDFPGYKGNHIYYTDDLTVFGGKERNQLNSDVGVFNLENRSFETLPGFKCVPRFLWPPPVWVTPNPY